MSSISSEVHSKFQTWLHANELHFPRDFNSLSLARLGRLRHAQKHQKPLPTPGTTLWTKSRHRGTGRMAAHIQDTRPALKLWRCFRSRKLRADQGLANDTARRRLAAKDALHIALSWKEQGRLAREWCSLHPTKRDTWVEMHIMRIAIAEASTVRSALRTWKHWCAWYLDQGEDPFNPTEAALATFLYTPARTKRARQVPKTVPATRFNHSRWIEANMGAPIRLNVSDRPARQIASDGLPPEQRAASDPEAHIHLDHLLAQLTDADPTSIVAAVIQLLDERPPFPAHQRSMPIKLTAHLLYGVCWKGKGKPGYIWACPRHGPTGADVGSCIRMGELEEAGQASFYPTVRPALRQRRSVLAGKPPCSQPSSAQQWYLYE